MLLDTEFTAWEGSQGRCWSGPDEHREIIQIAAVLLRLDANGVTVEDQFNTLVQPRINPCLSEYITALTGITQTMIDELGVDLGSAVRAFHRFCQDGQLPVLSWGNDNKVIHDNCVLVNLPFPRFRGGMFNVQAWLKKHDIEEASLNSGQVAKSIGVTLHGHEHNALFDVKSVAAALHYWLEKDAISLPDLTQWWSSSLSR